MKEYIPKVTLLVRQGLENVENLPFIIQGLEYVDNGEYIPVQYRKAFYKFLNDFFKVTMSDSTIFRLIRTRVSALPGKHQKEELKMKDLIERRLGYKNLSKSLAHRKGVRGLGKFSSKLGNKKRNTMTEETVTEKKHSKHIGFDGLVKKLMAQGKSRKYAEAIAGKVNAEKHGTWHEETNLQELNDNTLANYWRKATAHVGRFKYTSRGEFMDQKKVNKRAKGRLMAASKLHSREQSHKLSSNLGESRIDPVTAHEILTKHNAHGDFYALNHDSVSGLIASAKEHGYRKSKNAPGSTARMFHSHLTRLAARRDKNLGEETDLQEVSSDKAVSYISRAAGDAKMNRLKSISHGKAGQNDQAKFYWKKVRKRLKGINTAKEKFGIQAEEINLQENIDLKSASVASLESIIQLPAKKRLAGGRASAYEIQLAKSARMELLRRRQKGVKEEVEQEIYETLSADAKSGDWIHDFVHSKNKRFKGKSKQERIRMALGAYYNHHTEQIDINTVRLTPITEHQLNELKAETYARYNRVAEKDAGRHEKAAERAKEVFGDTWLSKGHRELAIKRRGKISLARKLYHKKITKEETDIHELDVENMELTPITEDQLQELYQSTTKSYIKKATRLADRIDNKLNKVEDKAMSTDGEKYPERQRKYEKMAQKLGAKLGKRRRGIKLAKSKLTEDQLQELYQSTTKSYIKKATKSADRINDKLHKAEDKAMSTDGEKYPERQRKYEKMSQKLEAKWGKRLRGIELAKDKLKEETQMSEYRDRFSAALKKFGITDVSLLDEIAMKDFLTYVDTQNESVISAAGRKSLPMSDELKAQIAADMAKRKEKKNTLLALAKDEYSKIPSSSYRNRPKDAKKLFHKIPKSERTE